MSASPGAGGPPAKRLRTATVVVAVLVLGLVALLVGLVGTGGSDGAGASPASSASVRPAASEAATASPTRALSTRRPSAPSTASTASTASPRGRDPQSGLRLVALDQLPREAQATVALIDRGGPFPYTQDGVTFGNYERVLPAHPRGWYREYTVRTPGQRDRGPRRIVTGDDDTQLFYTADHYATFVRVTR